MAKARNQDPVLLAEDEANDVFFMQLAFEEAGVTNPLIIVPNGKAAIAYLSGTGIYADRDRHPLPCLLLTDLKMPDMDGFGLLRWLREQPRFYNLPKIIISSSSLEADMELARELEACAYFVKPNNFSKLVELVQMVKSCCLHPV